MPAEVVDALAAVLGAEAVAADWARKQPSAASSAAAAVVEGGGGAAFAALGGRPTTKRARGDHEWALK